MLRHFMSAKRLGSTRGCCAGSRITEEAASIRTSDAREETRLRMPHCSDLSRDKVSPDVVPAREGKKMTRRIAFVALSAALVGLSIVTSTQERGGPPSTVKGDWPHYTADVKGTKYSPLDQIDTSNFKNLEVAWRFKTDMLGPRPEFKLEGTPLAINGVLYTTGGTRRSVVALGGRTGELMWSHSLREGKRAGVAPRQLSGRGPASGTDGRGDDRVIYVTTGYRLVALNSHNGAPIAGFG